MKTCKDCIHDKLCDEWAVTSGIPFVNADTCQHFKNKADFVEVVRCVECKYIQIMSDGKTLACIRQSAFRKPTDFCSYGEKRSDT